MKTDLEFFKREKKMKTDLEFFKREKKMKMSQQAGSNPSPQDH